MFHWVSTLRCTKWDLQVRLRSRIFIYLVWKVCQLQCINACKLARMTQIGYCADSDKTWHCHTIKRLWSFVVHPRQLCTKHEHFPFQPAAKSYSCGRTTLVGKSSDYVSHFRWCSTLSWHSEKLALFAITDLCTVTNLCRDIYRKYYNKYYFFSKLLSWHSPL